MPDRCTALAFDSAVMTFGLWVENKLAEHDDDYQPLYNLRELLDLETEEDRMARNSSMFAAFMAMTHGGTV